MPPSVPQVVPPAQPRVTARPALAGVRTTSASATPMAGSAAHSTAAESGRGIHGLSSAAARLPATDADARASGSQASASPVSLALELMARSDHLEENLRTVERDLYDLETAYLQDANQTGSVLRGFEAFLSARSNVTSTKRPRKFQTEDRVFSLSSATSLATEEGGGFRDADGRGDGSGIPLPGGGVSGPSAFMGRVRQSASTYSATAAGTPSSGPGKQQSQKRGRVGSTAREGKKLRQQIEQDDSDDEDSQTSSLA